MRNKPSLVDARQSGIGAVSGTSSDRLLRRAILVPILFAIIVAWISIALWFAPSWANWPGGINRQSVYAIGVCLSRTLSCTLFGVGLGTYVGWEEGKSKLSNRGVAITAIISGLVGLVSGAIWF